MAPVFQTLVDRVFMPCLVFLLLRTWLHQVLYPVRSQLHEKTPHPPGLLPGAMSPRPKWGNGLGGASGEATSPRLRPSTNKQVATRPGWVMCVDSRQGRMWSVSCAPCFSPCQGWRRLEWAVSAQPWKTPRVRGGGR